MKRQRAYHLIGSRLILLLVVLTFKAIDAPTGQAAYVPVYRGGICVADATGNCIGRDIRAESGLGSQVGYMKTTADAGTVAVYRGTCYSDPSGTCTAWGLSLDVNGSPVGYLSTTAPDTGSANSPLVQSNGLLLQNLGGTASAFLWTVIPPSIATVSPGTGPVGTSVTISGSNFGATQESSTVTFNGTAASPTSWTDSSIGVPIPAGATTGLIVVTVSGLASNGVNFTITGSNPTKLAVTSVNGGSSPSAGVGFAVTVQAQDAGGVARNVTANTAVSLNLKTGTGTVGGTLAGTIAAGTNQVILTIVTYTKAETGVVITASRTSGDTLTAGDSPSFTVIAGAATALVFATQPGGTTGCSALAGPPVIVVQDSFGNTVTSSTASITVAIGNNPASGTLSGTTTKNVSGGIASFNDLSINKAGTGYTLAASATELTGATSSTFNITPAAAANLVFTTQPANSTAGGAIGGPVTVAVQDDFGNTVTSSTASITIAVGTNPGGGTLSGTTTKSASSGVATFTDLSINKAANGYTLTVSSTGLTGTTSSSFNINAGAAVALVFNTQPGNASAGSAISGPPTITVQDSFGNPVTSSTALITVAIGTNPSGGTLSGTLSKNATAGVVSFNDLSIDKIGPGYTLVASSTGLTGSTSAAFNIGAGTATKLAFTTQPGNATAGYSISGPPTVTVQDALGNTVTSSTASIALAIGTNPGSGTLGGTTTVNASSGVAAFNGLSINQAGTGYTLAASSTGLTGATSNAFNITSSNGLGIISGFVTLVSDGIGVSGALVEIFQGIALVATGSTSTSGAYSIGGLADGVYAVRASSSGFVPQVRERITIANAAPATVNLTLNVGIAIYSPLAGSLINDYSVLVTGEFDTSLASEVGISVNGVPAKINMETFSAVVAIAPQTITLTATVTAVNGSSLASESIPITVQSSEPPLTLQARPAEGIARLTVSFDLTTLLPVSQVSLDANGDGTVDFQGSTVDLAVQSFIFQQTGLYYPSVTVTDSYGATHSAVALIQVYDATSFDSLFQQKWQGFKNALRAGNTAAALLYIALDERAAFQGIFQNLTVPLSSIDQVLTNIQFVESSGDTEEYEMLRTDSRGQLSYLVRFVLDRDGIWRIQDL